MASWLHAEYEAEASDAARLAELRLHIAEVSTQINASWGLLDRRKDYGTLVEYLKMLTTRRAELERITGGSSGASMGIQETLVEYVDPTS